MCRSEHLLHNRSIRAYRTKRPSLPYEQRWALYVSQKHTAFGLRANAFYRFKRSPTAPPGCTRANLSCSCAQSANVNPCYVSHAHLGQRHAFGPTGPTSRTRYNALKRLHKSCCSVFYAHLKKWCSDFCYTMHIALKHPKSISVSSVSRILAYMLFLLLYTYAAC